MPGGDRRGCSAPLKTDTQDVVQAWGSPSRWTAPRGRARVPQDVRGGSGAPGKVAVSPRAAGRGEGALGQLPSWPLAGRRRRGGRGGPSPPAERTHGRCGRSAGGARRARGRRVLGGGQCHPPAGASGLAPAPRVLGTVCSALGPAPAHSGPASPPPRPRPDGGAGCTLHADSGHAASCPSHYAAHGRARGRGGSRGAAGSCRVQDPTVQVPD